MPLLSTSSNRSSRRPQVVAFGVVAVVALVVVGVVGYLLVRVFSGDDPDRADGVGDESDAVVDGDDVDADDPEPSDLGAGEAHDADDVAAGDVGDGFVPPAWSLIANLDADIPAFSEPDGDRVGVVDASWHGRASALRVFEERGDWLLVGLQQRPNESTAWVRRDDVVLTSTPYWIRVDVGAMRLRLYRNSELVMDAPVGVGTDDAPTPTGEFFVTFLQEPPDDGGNWGSFVMVTSSHSETISDYQLSGDAITGIHGPLGSAASIGDTGARVSKGCVRLHLDDLDRLRVVPAGSPIDIVDSTGAPST